VDLAVVEQRRTAGGERLQQRARVAQQCVSPVAFGRPRLDQPLLEPANRDRHLRVRIVLDRRQTGGDDLGEQIGRSAQPAAEVARRVVVGGEQAPKTALAHQRHHQGGGHAHVLQVLQEQGRHAAQCAHRHVELGRIRVGTARFDRPPRRCSGWAPGQVGPSEGRADGHAT
jgi:hypothetical protein